MKTQSEKEKKLNLALSKLQDLSIENPSLKINLGNLSNQKINQKLKKKR